MFVCPIYEANTTSLEIEFPVSDDWIYWFNNVGVCLFIFSVCLFVFFGLKILKQKEYHH
jgi:hypothetical protein